MRFRTRFIWLLLCGLALAACNVAPIPSLVSTPDLSPTTAAVTSAVPTVIATSPAAPVSTPIEDTPQLIEDTPVPILEDTPQPIEETRTPVEDTPAPIEDTPIPLEDTPTPIEDTPTPTHIALFLPFMEEPLPSSTETPEATAPPDPPTETPEAIAMPELATLTPSGSTSVGSGDGSLARGTITKRPWIVMIDNHPNAWPQSGLDRASIVFEALAEGGITRFMAVFQDGLLPDAPEIGPVRSVRLYFVQWAMGFQGVLMHAGGSPDGLELARSTDQIVNAEALALPHYARRIDRRSVPHNLYTSSELLRAFVNDKDQSLPDDPEIGYLFDQIAPAEPIQAATISYRFTDPTFRASWTYDPETNGYLRTMSGRPHSDQISGKQLWARNVVVMETNEALRPGDTKGRLDVHTIGSGPALIFSAGQRIEATWRKEDAAAPLRFYDTEDQEIVFNVGTIWIAAIASMDRLTIE